MQKKHFEIFTFYSKIGLTKIHKGENLFMTEKKGTKAKLISIVISMVCALSLLAVGVLASLTNFQVAIANQLSLEFSAVEGTLYATRLGDVAGTDRTTSKVLSESTTATDWLKVYDGTTTAGIVQANLDTIQEQVNFISNDAVKQKVEAGASSIAITYYFYYTLPGGSVSNDVVLTAPAMVNTNVKLTYSYIKTTSSTLPSFDAATTFADGDTVQVTGGEHLFVKAEARVGLTGSVNVESADWTFTLNFGISKFSLTNETLTFNEVSGAETYEVWAKEITASGASLIAQTSSVGDTDTTLGTLKQILTKDTRTVNLETALSDLTAGNYKVTIVPKDISGKEITGNRISTRYTFNPKITLTFTFSDLGSGLGGIYNVKANGTAVTTLDVMPGLTFAEIISQYNLTFFTYAGPSADFSTSYWDQGDASKVFTTNTTITFSYYSCLEINTEITVYDEKKKKYIRKKLKDITYDDLILVWNFDKGDFDLSKPIFIAKTRKADRYTLVKFSDGSELKLVGPDDGKRHRIFNVDTGVFEYVGNKMPVGTRTFNEKGEIVTVTSIEFVNENIEFSSIKTYYHINCFAGGILTSGSFSNLYPIKDMKYVKDNRTLASRKDYLEIEDKYFYGLRLAERPRNTLCDQLGINDGSLNDYINKLKDLSK